MLDVLFMPYGVMFMEHHFKIFLNRPLKGVVLRLTWLSTVTLLSMAYQATLKVSKCIVTKLK